MLLNKKERQRTLRHSNLMLSQPRVKTILRTVPRSIAFHFYEGIGKPTGQVATSLLDFCNKINSVQSTQAHASLIFHQKRGDFENWIRDVILDYELAKRISRINPNKPMLKMKLYVTVNMRIKQMKETLHAYATSS